MNLSAITRGLFLSLLLSACGGSGGGGGDVVDGSGVAKSFRVHTEALTPLPKRTDILRETGVNILAKVADISGNGYPDVLFITGYGQENFGDIDYEPGK